MPPHVWTAVILIGIIGLVVGLILLVHARDKKKS